MPEVRKQERMNAIQNWFEGRKTYLTCLSIGALLFGSWQGWWQLPAEVYAGLLALATAFLRAGLTREMEEARAANARATGIEGGVARGADEAGISGPGPAPASGVGKKVPVLVLAAGLGAALLTTCGTLDPAGVYHGDKTLYTSDLALGAAYDSLQGFVQWEYEHRAALASQPAIRQAADQARAQATQWFATAMALRDAYAATPTTANQNALSSALAVIQEAVARAAAWNTNSTR